MRKVNKSWMATLVAGVLLAALGGVVWARPSHAPENAEITRKVTLTGGDFIAAQSQNWYNSGQLVRCNGVNCHFTAPVVFPCLPSVTVKRIKLHVYDNNTAGACDAEARLMRANPATGAEVELGEAATWDSSSTYPETIASLAINKVVWPSQKAYIALLIECTNIDVFGVTVEYRRNI